MSNEELETQEETTQEETAKKIEYKCPVCGEGVKFTSDPLTKKLKAIKCATNVFDRGLGHNVGCDFIVYSNQKLLEPKVLLKEELKSLVAGETLRINNQNVYIDAANPTVVQNKKSKKDVRYYLKIERDEDIEEEI